MKYKVIIKFQVEGPVDKDDILGSIFNNTREILDFNLEDLIKQRKISRLKVIEKGKLKKEGQIIFFSNLTKEETALIIALIEKVNRVAHFPAKFKFEKLEDLREQIKKEIIKRAKEILKELNNNSEIIENSIVYPKNIDKFEEIILVEGKRDFENLVKNGIKNVIAINGIEELNEKIKKLESIIKNKKVAIFFDNDKGGKFLTRLIRNKIKVDYIILPKKGQKVEEMTKKEIIEALKNKIDVEKINREIKEEIKKVNKLNKILEKTINQ